MKVQFKRLNPDAVLPKFAHPGDAGMDVYSITDTVIAPRGWTLVSTGLAANIPAGHEIQIRPRSGLAKNGIVAMFGTVDCGYKGGIGVQLYNFNPDAIMVKKGSRIAQLVLSPIIQTEIEEVDDVGTSERGEGGFGSTGV